MVQHVGEIFKTNVPAKGEKVAFPSVLKNDLDLTGTLTPNDSAGTAIFSVF
jgi:hypothetical protein